MRTDRSLKGLCGGLLIAALAALAPVPALAATSAPAWAPIAVNGPTNLPPSGEGEIAIYAQNIGGLTSSGTVTIEEELPAGLLTAGPAVSKDSVWSCPGGAGLSKVTCTSTGNIASDGQSSSIGPGIAARSVVIPVSVTASTPQTLTNKVTVSGGGASSPAVYEGPVTISSIPAKPGFQAFTAGAYDVDGSPAVQAGSHPYTGSSAIFVNTIRLADGNVVPAGDPRTIAVELPPGFLGNPIAVPTCAEGTDNSNCPIDSQVGIAQPLVNSFGSVTGFGPQKPVSVHNIEAPFGYPSKFTFEAANLVQINALGGVRSDGDYGITVESPNTPQIVAVYGVFFTFWGSPADSSHDGQRCVGIEPANQCGPSSSPKTAFLTMPTGCALHAEQRLANAGPFATLKFDTWLTTGQFNISELPVPVVEGCENLQFDADFTFEPSETKSDSPASFRTELRIPSEGLTNPDELMTPTIRESVVELPKGVVLNASAADGLGACSEQQIGLKGTNFPAPNRIRFSKEAQSCPDNSKIGSGELKSELLTDPLQGDLYLAAQGEGNPFGSLFAIYLVIEDPRHGIFIKLPGEVQVNEADGQQRIVFRDLPQLPFTYLRLNLKGGNRSPLASPMTCGNFVTNSINTPWSAPESGPPTTSANGFEINQGPNGQPCAPTLADRPFDLGLHAGTDSTAAGAFSPLSFNITRPDGSQEIDGLELTTAPGIAASLKGIGRCTDEAIARASASTGKEEQANPACPGQSQIGRLLTGAGSGPAPFYAAGKLYLAGPYKGAPLSVVAITPAVAGPFDLGNVVVRTAVFLNRSTAQVTAKADPIPQVLEGVPLRIKDIRVILDRPGFSLNPTSCDANAIKVKLSGNSGAVANLSSRFQVGGCNDLDFKPKFAAKLIGGTKRGDHPKFIAEVNWPQGAYANTKDVAVTLPRSEFLDQANIRTICTRVQAAADTCPPGAVYGEAEAITPLLEEPLRGPVFLKSSDNKLPDLAIKLRGPASMPVEVEFQGRIDSIKGQIRNTIEGLPDVPVTKFVLRMQGGRKGLLVNSRNLCTAKKGRMDVRVLGHNNKRADQKPVLKNSCKKRKGKKQKRAQR